VAFRVSPQHCHVERFKKMHPDRAILAREAVSGRLRWQWRVLTAAMAAVLAVSGCDREPQTPPPAAPAGRAATGSAPLPSWNDGASRKAIVDFVARVTRDGSPDFVPPAERIATFDNDGTLWSEQPIYFQLAFALDRVKALAPDHPEWKTRQPFKGVLEGDIKAVSATGERGMLELVAATHVGNTTDEFAQAVSGWLASARHPKTNRPYTEMVYQPMLEILAYLRANGFKTFIVSGGGIEFMRGWTERVYGIPPEQVIGSRAKMKYEPRGGVPVLLRLAEIDHVDDKAGKPVGIQQVIGRRPIAAFGNSDGDFEMLEWVTSGPGPRLGVIVHHTDAEREWAYDRGSEVGRLERGLDEAAARRWIVVDMKQDWRVIYPEEARQ
jgi:phosphoglycolate phosphatase-like HAD superfamily hydrolase